jgi:hypothetical protein
MKRHCNPVTRVPSVAQSSIALLFQGLTEIIDRLLLAQRQWAWKTPFPIGGGPDGGGGGGVDPGVGFGGE